MPLPFNKTFDLKLINLVKENPVLYNTKHPKYIHFDSREVAWQKIGDALNRPGSVCKSRWTNIRDMMRRKFKERLKNPSERIYNYKYEEQLAFMTPFFRDIYQTEDFSYLDDDETHSETTTQIYITEDGEFEETQEFKPSPRKRLEQPSSSRSTREYTSEVVHELSPADPIDVFLMTIGSTLRKFSPYYLNQAKSKIFQLVQDYELKQIVNKDEQYETPQESGENSC